MPRHSKSTSPLFKILKAVIFRKRATRLCNALLPYIEAGETVLDFGCGTLTVAEEIAKVQEVQIHGVDVIDFNLTDFPLLIYDGTKTQFKDNAFDTTYATFVLHHCDDVESVFSEIVRITRKRIILIEDTYETRFELFCIKVFDYVENRIGSLRMNIPFNFQTREGWIAFFESHKISRIHSKVLRPNSLRKHTLFVLDLIPEASKA